MSILHYPRLNFSGIISCNPCTANNDDVMPTVVEREKDALGVDVNQKTDDEIIAFMRTFNPMTNYGESAVYNYALSGWNLYGDHITTFKSAKFTSYIDPSGNVNTSDPLVGCEFNITGSNNPDGSGAGGAIMCDLDSTGLVTTQIYVGGINIKDKNNKEILQSFYDTRAIQNWLNFRSTVPTVENSGNPNGGYGGEQNFVGIGCVMQFVMPASSLPDSGSVSSPALQEVLRQGKDNAGLAIRIRMYEVEPAITNKTTENLFTKSGQWPQNPAYGYVVGTIGVHYAGEPETETMGRKLVCPYPRPLAKCYSPKGEYIQNVDAMPNQAPNAWSGSPALVGNAVAQLHSVGGRAVLSVDFSESFPKYGFRNPKGPVQDAQLSQGISHPVGFDVPKQMAYLGDLELAVSYNGFITPIGDINYAAANNLDVLGGTYNYNISADMVNSILKGDLLVRVKSTSRVNPGVVFLYEEVTRVVTDTRAAYLTLGTTDFNINVKVFERGGATTKDTVLYLKEYKNIIELASGNSCTADKNTVRTNQTTDIRSNQDQCPVDNSNGNRLSFDNTVTVPCGDYSKRWFPIPVKPLTYGAAVLNLQKQDVVMGKSVPAWTTCDYSSIRVFANEDYSKLPRPLKWEDVYRLTLRYYYLVFPFMSTMIPLNKASSITSPYAANLIKQRLNKPTTNPGQGGFWSTFNMPVTRTMSPSQIDLLNEFINQELKKSQG